MFRCFNTSTATTINTAATACTIRNSSISGSGSSILSRSLSTHGHCRHPSLTTVSSSSSSSLLLSHRRHLNLQHRRYSSGYSAHHLHRHHRSIVTNHHHHHHCRDTIANGNNVIIINSSSGSGRGASLSLVQQRSRSALVDNYDRVLEKLKEVDEALVAHAQQYSDIGPITAATVSPTVRRELADLQTERVKLLQEERMLIPEHIRHVQANDDIPRDVETVKLLDEEGKFLGDLPRSEALSKAKAAHLDIILINAKARPPLCRLGNFRQHIREELRKHEEAEEKRKRLEREMKPKEVRFKPKTGKRDVEMKIARAKEFLDSGKRVKLSVVSRNVDAAKTMLSEIMGTITQEDSTIVVDQQDQAGANMISTIIRRKK